MHILICFALKEEAAPFRNIAAGRAGLTILLTCIGRVNAERALRDYLTGGAGASTGRFQETPSCKTRLASTIAPPDLVLTCGFAGGLNPDLKVGDVAFEIPSRSSRRELAQTRFDEMSEPTDVGDCDLEKKLTFAGAKAAKFFCADRIATTIAEKKSLRDQTGADAVEMESAAIQAVCAEGGIPCITVRVISDSADDDLPLDFNALTRPDRNLDYGKLFLAIAKSPGKIGALMKLQKQTRFAAKRLAEVLARVV